MLISNNIFRNTYWDAVYLYNWGDIQPAHQLSNVIISNNDVEATGWADGMILIDQLPAFYGAEKSLDVKVFKNKIDLDVQGTGGIFSLGLRDAKISKNTVSGQGFAGFYSYYTEGMKLARLNTETFQPEVAHIYLGDGTNDCRIYGTGLDQTCYDWSDDPTTPEYDGTNYLWNVTMTFPEFIGKSPSIEQQILQKFQRHHPKSSQELFNK
jgi:hypothetical protein